jgi:glycosyltransferase involved in cell wall biosynthesis
MIDRLYPGGTETQLAALIRNFNRTLVKPFLCLLDGENEMSRSMEPPDCPVLRLGVRSLGRPATIRKAWQFTRFLRKEQIDILQVFFPDSTYFGVPLARLAGVPFILRTRNNLNHWMTPNHRRLGRLLNRWVTGTVTNCEASRLAVLADEKPTPSTVVVMENGVDLARFDGVPPFGSKPHGTRRVGVVANLRPVKGLETFVEAAAQVHQLLPQVEFHIAGEGALRPKLEQQSRQMGLGDRFFLPGIVQDIPAFLGTLDVAVLCSLAEGMSNAVLEYMAAGRAIVATTVGATVKLLENEVHGLLVPPGNALALAQAIRRLLEDVPAATRLAGNARRRVEEKYSRDVMVRTFEDFYRKLVVKGKFRAAEFESTRAHALQPVGVP